jgi:hypothetical protein
MKLSFNRFEYSPIFPSSKLLNFSSSLSSFLSALSFLPSPHPGKCLRNFIHIQGDFHEFQMLLITCRVDLGLHLRLDDVVNREPQRDPSQRPCPCRIPVGYRLSIEFGAVGIRSPEDNDEVLLSVLLCDLLDAFLTLQVKGACRSSDKTLCLYQQGLGSGTLNTGRNSRSLNPIPFPQDNDFLPFQFHCPSSHPGSIPRDLSGFVGISVMGPYSEFCACWCLPYRPMTSLIASSISFFVSCSPDRRLTSTPSL